MTRHLGQLALSGGFLQVRIVDVEHIYIATVDISHSGQSGSSGGPAAGGSRRTGITGYANRILTRERAGLA